MMEKQARELSLSDLYTYVIHSLIYLLIPLVFAVMFAFEGYEAIFYAVYLIGPLGIILMFYLHVVVFSIIFRLIIMVPQLYLFRNFSGIPLVIITIICQLFITCLGLVLQTKVFSY